MKTLFVVLVAGFFGFVAWKTVQMNRKPKGGYKGDDGSLGVGGAGEVPKDFKR